jgi:hypothetical protein
MNMKLFALILPFAMSTAALAEGSSFGTTSQYMHQTDAGKFEVTPDFMFGWNKVSLNQNPSNTLDHVNDNVFNLSVLGEYGINDMLSVGIKLGYQTDNMTPSDKTAASDGSFKGMLDPAVYLNGRVGAGPGQFRFGANLAFAITKGNIDGNFLPNGNEQDGGITLTPYVGYEMMLGSGLAGVRIAYDIIKTDQDDGAVVGKQSGGNTTSYALFYEMNMVPVIWGFDVALNTHNSTSTKFNGNTTANNDDYNDYEIATYAAWEVCPDITILPKIAYANDLTGRSGQIANEKSTNGFNVGVGARFAF